MSQRDNQNWVRDLRGDSGQNSQFDAFQDLANHLHAVAYNYLRRRGADTYLLNTLDRQDLASLAEDFVQSTLVRLSAKNCALLDKYSGTGAFLGWCTRLVTNGIASEIRKAEWRTRIRSADEATDPLQRVAEADRLAEDTLLAQIEVVLRNCIEHLSERRRIAFVHCIVENRPASDVADELQATANAVNQLVHHAKRDLRGCLESHGFGPETLQMLG